MASFLQIENLTKSFGDRFLFNDISFGINEGDKVGLIAKNGMGKTTLLRILSGDESYDFGKITYRNDLRVGYLPQLPQFDPNISVMDVCLNSDDKMSMVIKEYENALKAGTDLADVIHEMDALNAWDFEDRFKQILTELKITDYNQLISELSGGQIKRVALARVLISEPDILILDEPTNHLDIEMIEWIEKYLSRNRMTLLMVTHDRYFLDNVCNKIIEIDSSTIYSYDGNYDYYVEKRQQRIEIEAAEIAKSKNLLKTELDWMRRQPQARATKAKYRIDAFYELEKKANKKRDTSTIELNMKSGYIGSKIFEAHKVCKKFGDKVILDDFNYVFSRYDKVGIVGDNGVGKSTFIKLLQGIINPDSGYFDIGETVNFGYYSQDGLEFNESQKVIDAITDIAEVIEFDEKTKYTASQFLTHFLFSPSDQQKFINKLSGGEKRRLYLAAILMKKPNFLILDEPTNDLDIVTLEILEDYLEKFKGCVIIISHDRYFMDKTVDHIFVFEGDGRIKDFPGNYSEYREWKSIEKKKIDEELKINSAPVQKPKTSTISNKLTYKEKKEFELLTTELHDLEEEKKKIEYIFNNPNENPSVDISQISIRYNELSNIMDEKEMRWLELSEKE